MYKTEVLNLDTLQEKNGEKKREHFYVVQEEGFSLVSQNYKARSSWGSRTSKVFATPPLSIDFFCKAKKVSVSSTSSIRKDN